MKNYPKSKPTGIVWMGEVPEHWVMKRLKYVADFVNGYAFSSEIYTDNGVPLIRIGEVKPVIDLENAKRVPAYLKDELTQFIVRKGDILIALTGYLGQATRYSFDEDALLNQRVGIVRPNRKDSCSNDYLFYLIDSSLFRTHLDLEGKGSAQDNIGKPEIAGFPVPFPPLREQQAITIYLDDKTRKIDTLIEKKQRLIELLKEQRTAVINQAVTKGINPNVKMKNSGIEWIGEIPEHWSLIRLKRVARVVNGSTPKSAVDEYWNGEICWVTPDDIGKLDGKYISDSNRRITQKGLENCGTTLVPKHSIVLSTRAPIGHLGIAMVDLCTNQGCKSIVRLHMSSEYLYYLLFSAKEELKSYGQGSTFTELSSENLADFVLPNPPLPEQEEIARFVDAETSEIDVIAQQFDRQINTLKEYRTALISEVVTGKVDIRDYVFGKNN